MKENYPKNKDPRPKRRRDKGNPYEIFTVGIETDSPHYYISFTDSQGVHVCMEINRSLFELFDRFELDDLSYLNEFDRHRVYDEISDDILFHHSSSAAGNVEDRFKFDHLHEAIGKLPRTQKRRLMLYYFSDYSMEEIARIEGCTQSSVSRTITKAEKNLIKFLKGVHKM